MSINMASWNITDSLLDRMYVSLWHLAELGIPLREKDN